MAALEKIQTPALSEAISIGIMDVQKVNFYINEGGFTALDYEGKDYKRIGLRRALPIGQPLNYISVVDSENKEIGIIKSVAELDKKQQEIITSELDNRYYCPEIKQIKSVKDKMGYVYMELTVGSGNGTYLKNCAVKDVTRNIRMLDENRLVIFDVDGNRYIVNSLSNLDKKSLKQLEPYML